MKEITSIIVRYGQLKKADAPCALATVVHVEDSSYRRSGARMLITRDGQWVGGISGGCLEGDTLKKAQQAIDESRAITVRYDTREDDTSQIGVGLGCNGLIDVLIVPLDHSDDRNPVLFLSENEGRTARIFVTIVHSPEVDSVGKVLFVNDDFSLSGNISAETLPEGLSEKVIEVKQDKKSKTVEFENGEWKFFLEYLPPPIHLCIFGKNYDTIPLAEVAKLIGWRVTVIANPLKVPTELYNIADQVISPSHDLPQTDEYTAALLMSHDYETDKRNLALLSPLGLPYIGLLGPKKRRDKIYQELDAEGVTLYKENIFAPIGLDTGATTPEEIAISMIAEIRTHFSNRSGGFLRDRLEKIND